jgi:hypothetical protein
VIRRFASQGALTFGCTRMYDLDVDIDLVLDPPPPDRGIMQLVRIEPARPGKRIAGWDQESGTWKLSRIPRRKS